jgi:ABC-2 type transport system ATP-binding protein
MGATGGSPSAARRIAEDGRAPAPTRSRENAPVPGPAIETNRLSKLYAPGIGIEDIDLQVPAGGVFGFLGPNGAGKTTLIRVLLDLIRPTAGSARVLGRDSRKESLEIRRRTGYLPGDLRLPRRRTGRAMLEHFARLRRGAGAGAIEGLAGRLALDLDRPLDELSRGNRQKAGLVLAFMHDPDLLVLDEPTSGLDPLRQREVQELIRERAAAGRTVLLSSHALDQVEHVAERVGIVRGGRLIAVESVAALKRRSVREVDLRLAAPARPEQLERLARLAGVDDLRSHDRHLRFRVSGPMDAVVKQIAQLDVAALTSAEPELEEIFLELYGSDDDG